MSATRNKRISEEIRRIVSELIRNGLKDPRITEFTSITDVQTTKDLRYVYIYVSTYNPKIDKEETIEALNNAKGYIRKEIGKKMNIRYTPEPIFKRDDSVMNAMHIDEIIRKVNKKEDE